MLSFDFLRAGARAYIAVAGGIDVPVVFGSRSTYTLCALGGHRGPRARRPATSCRSAPRAPLRPGARVRESSARRSPRRSSCASSWASATTGSPRRAGARSSTSEWTVTPAADRIGYRYRGGQLSFVEREQPFGAGSDPSNVVDARLSRRLDPGTRRRRADLPAQRRRHRAAATPTIGTVISADRDVLAQSKTHGKTRFRAVGIEEALEARAERARPPRRDARRPLLARQRTTMAEHHGPVRRSPAPSTGARARTPSRS